jgi:hypothetical protein
MKATLRYLMILALCLLPFTFIQNVEFVDKERFPIVIGITLAVTIAYWVSYAIIEKKRREQKEGK